MRKRILVNFSTLLILLSVVSCTTSKLITKGIVSYDMEVNVEHPTDIKVKFSDTKVQKIDEVDSIGTYTYEDDQIKITWTLGKSFYHFNLLNKTNYTIQLNWDNVSFVSAEGEVFRMLHSGNDFKDYTIKQIPTNIPKGAFYKDYLLPVNSFGEKKGVLYYDILDSIKNANDVLRQKGTNTTITLPIIIQEVPNEYSFSFVINDVRVAPKETSIKVVEKGATSWLIIGSIVGLAIVGSIVNSLKY